MWQSQNTSNHTARDERQAATHPSWCRGWWVSPRPRQSSRSRWRRGWERAECHVPTDRARTPWSQCASEKQDTTGNVQQPKESKSVASRWSSECLSTWPIRSLFQQQESSPVHWLFRRITWTRQQCKHVRVEVNLDTASAKIVLLKAADLQNSETLLVSPIATHLPHEGVQRVTVRFPVARQVLSGWEFVASQFQRDLKAVGRQIVEVLHACRNQHVTSSSSRTASKTLFTEPELSPTNGTFRFTSKDDIKELTSRYGVPGGSVGDAALLDELGVLALVVARFVRLRHRRMRVRVGMGQPPKNTRVKLRKLLAFWNMPGHFTAREWRVLVSSLSQTFHRAVGRLPDSPAPNSLQTK